MKSLIKISLIGGLGVVILVAGAVLWARQGWFQPIAMMTIENRSGQGLRGLEVVHESGLVRSTVALPKLAAGQVFNFRFYVGGEGGYTVNAVLADGTAIAASERYVESGYHVTEVISATKIVTEP